MHRYLISCCIILCFIQCNSTKNRENFADKFQKLNADPKVITFSNNQTVNNEGGHLQGVQLYSHMGNDYAFMTGSSSTYSYYAVVDLGEEPRVISVNKILEIPLKHAGGFQIYENYMAIGIEDNEARDRSKVYLYKINDPTNPPSEPIAIINRQGEYERATAGAVGLTRVQNRLLLVVGDWSSRNLDFYISVAHDDQNEPLAFKKVHTINAREANKEDWINEKWHSYQNVNIIKKGENELYLAGLGWNDQEKNVADLYGLNTENFERFTIQKLASKTFQSEKDVSFRAGAGVYYKNNQLKLVACQDHLRDQSFLNLYSVTGE